MEDVALTGQPEKPVKRRKLNLNKKTVIILLVVLALVLAGLSSYYFYNQYKKSQALLQGQSAQGNGEAGLVIAAVGKLIELPTGEAPTIATVSDRTKLADQPFFKNAQNGDKVLVYAQAKKAILYRPSINKIIEVAPVNLSASASPSPSQLSPSPSSLAPSASPLPSESPAETETPVPAE